MMHRFSTALRRFGRGEDGSMVVPFALWTPVIIGLIVSSIELGTVTIRHTVMERGLDTVVRDLKLGNGVNSHAELKQRICDEAKILPACTDMLQIEMIQLNMNEWSAPSKKADCVDTSADIRPLRNFQHGGGDEMMLIRACYKFKPATPIGSLNASLPTDANGYTAIVSATAYVNEPS